MTKWSVIDSVIHEFSDPGGATMVGAEWINFESLTYGNRWKSLSQTPSKIILSSVAASN